MRPSNRLLPAFLALVLPLGTLAWLGSAELRRQDLRAQEALDDQARTFLDEAAKRVEEHVRRTANSLVGRVQVDSGRGPIHEARRLTSLDDRVGLFVAVDARGGIVWPRTAPERPGYVALRPGGTQARELAHVLELQGDHAGAIGVLSAELAEHPDNPATLFQLAGLVRSTATDADQRSRAEQLFERAATSARRLGARLASSDPLADPGRLEAATAIELLSEVALAELTVEGATTDVEPRELFAPLLDCMQRIADGRYDHLDDGSLGAVLDRLAAHLPDEASWRTRVARIEQDDEFRRRGRVLLATGRGELRSRMRDAVESATLDGVPRLQLVDPTRGPGIDAGWMTLRVVSAAERTALAQMGLRDVYWIGLRLDLDLLLDQAAALGERGTDLMLQVLTPEGDVLWPATTAPTWAPLAARRGLDGLDFAATPVDVEAALAENSAAFRNRALLLVSLCVTALGGAFFLVRNVSRETDLARLRVDLVSRVTHDLKTPLALIKMYADTIGMGRAADPAVAQRFASVISREADTLTRNIERVLDFSRQDLGSNAFDQARDVSLNDLIEQVVAAFLPHATARNVALLVSPDEGEDDDAAPSGQAVVHVDAGAMERALLNLLENAVKYTPEEAEERAITLAWRRRPGRPDRLLVEVRDRGIGIPKAERERVFEGFYRASNASEVRGTGLGLSMVRRFAKAHGGAAFITDREEFDGLRGSIVTIELPIAGDGETAEVPIAEQEETQESAPCHASS